MTITRRDLIKSSAAIVALGAFSRSAEASDDPLPSWNDGASKKAILSFVKDTTEKSSSKYVEPNDRVATFDQDGTLWTEHPLYTQAMFALHRLGTMAPQHPEWKGTEPFKSVLAGDREAMSKFSEKDWMEIVAVTHAGMGTEEFLALVKPWITTAKAPRFDRLFTDLVYQPMLEVMRYLREKDFRVYIVTGRRTGIRARLQRSGVWRSARTGRRLKHRNQVRHFKWKTRTAARTETVLH